MEKDNSNLGKYEKFLIYVLLYTILFFIFIATLKYSAPFLVAVLVGKILVKPVKALSKKLKINTTIGTIVIVTLFYTVLITILTLLIIRVVNQTGALFNTVSNYITANSDNIPNSVMNFYQRIEQAFKNLNPAVSDQIVNIMNSTVSGATKFVGDFGKSIINFFISIVANLPYISLVIVFSMICTYFFTMKFVQKPNALIRYLPLTESQREKFYSVSVQAKDMVGRYIGSFLLVIGITGFISGIAYWILGIPYFVALAFLTAFLDLLPVLGVSAAYIPLALVYISQGNFKVPIGLAILYGIVTIGRNIWEPKIMASSLDLSPITTLVSIFVGLQVAGFKGMIFMIFLAVGYKILLKVKVLEPLNS